jgi:hypothetical protein
MMSVAFSIALGVAGLALGAAGLYFTIVSNVAVDEIREHILKSNK